MKCFVNFVDTIHILVFKINIIDESQDKFHYYFRLVVIFLNSNIIWNKIPQYFVPDFIIKYILWFFSSVFEVYFHSSLKKLAFKLLISIPLEYININLAIVFETHDGIQSR